MAKATRNNNTTTKEETKMAKYIVEAPEPKKGQKVSSGGIRENGKLASQFKNPVPYKEQARARRNEAGMYLLGLAWQEFGEPLLRSSLRKLGNTIINKIECPSEQPSCKSGSNVSSSSADGVMNMFVMKCACHATSTMKRIAIRVSLFAPQNASTTYSFLLESSF